MEADTRLLRWAGLGSLLCKTMRAPWLAQLLGRLAYLTTSELARKTVPFLLPGVVYISATTDGRVRVWVGEGHHGACHMYTARISRTPSYPTAHMDSGDHVLVVEVMNRRLLVAMREGPHV